MTISSMSKQWPLIGRLEELEFIKEALGRPESHGVVLAGASGVGKTRLAWEAGRQAARREIRCEWAVATKAAASIPFSAFAHLLPDLPPRAEGLDVLLEAVRAISEKASESPMVLVVDDAHLLDDPSATLVHHLASRGVIKLIATVRSGEAPPDPITALWKEGLVDRLEVQALSKEESTKLVSAGLGDQVSRRTLFELWSASRGNALLLRELVLGGLESGALSKSAGVWQWRGPMTGGSRLREVVESRIGRLSKEEREAAEVLAFGEPMSAEVFVHLADPAALHALERRGVVESIEDGHRLEVRLSHPLYAEMLRFSTPRSRGRSIRKLLADQFELLGCRRREDALRVAGWLLEAGGARESGTLLTAAAYAIGAFDYLLAERLATAAVNAGGGFRARLLLADALRSQKKGEEAEELLARLEGEAENDQERSVAVTLRAYNLFFGCDRGEEAQTKLREAEARVSESGSLDLILSCRAILYLYGGQPLDAMDSARRVPSGETVHDGAWLDAKMAEAAALAITGRTEQAIEIVDEAFARAESLGAEGIPRKGSFSAVAFLALRLAGRLEEAESFAEAAYEIALNLRSHDFSAMMLAALGNIALAQGRVKVAEERLREACALLRERDRNGFLPWCLAEWAQAQAFLGDHASAEQALEEGLECLSDSNRIFSIWFDTARAWVLASRGEISTAKTIALEAARQGRTTGQVVFEAIALHDVARMGYAREVSERLVELAKAADGSLLAAFEKHVEGLVAGEGELLDEASRAFESMGAYLFAAEAAAEAAHAHSDAGRLSRSSNSTERSKALSESLGAKTPVLSALGEIRPLTIREREIALLAASGLSSREIAERLFVSVRTVDNHLHHVYSKLGMTGRADFKNWSIESQLAHAASE